MIPVMDLGHLLSGSTLVEFTYTNWRGETSRRRAIMLRLFRGTTEWHPEEQWLLEGIDLDKRRPRTYALKDVKEYVSLGREDQVRPEG